MRIEKTKISYPVKLEEVKEHLRELDSYNDAYLTRLIKVATAEAEAILGMDIAYTDCLVRCDEYPGGDKLTINEGNFIKLGIIKLDDVVVVGAKTICHPSSFDVLLPYSIGPGMLSIAYTSGLPEDTPYQQDYEAIKQYILIRCDDLYGPERSSYSFNALKNTNNAERLLSGLKGYY